MKNPPLAPPRRGINEIPSWEGQGVGKKEKPWVLVVTQPGKLTKMEYRIIQNHSQVGFDILKEIEFPWPIARIIQQHHERLDGSGYPNHLSNNEILPEAKIIGVADTVEAVASHRPYRPALGLDKALEIITNDLCIRLLFSIIFVKNNILNFLQDIIVK